MPDNNILPNNIKNSKEGLTFILYGCKINM